MKVDFTGRHFTVTPAIKKHAREQLKKISKLLGSKEINSAHFVLEVEKYRHRAELLIDWQNQSLSAVATTNDMYLAINQVVEKMERRAQKIKEKWDSKKRVVRKKLEEENDRAGEDASSKIERNHPRIILIEADIKPMSADEAVESLLASGEDFFVYTNSENNRVSVLFKRKDGNYGLVEA